MTDFDTQKEIDALIMDLGGSVIAIKEAFIKRSDEEAFILVGEARMRAKNVPVTPARRQFSAWLGYELAIASPYLDDFWS